MKPALRIGEVVQYHLSPIDVERIRERRTTSGYGNAPYVGELVPLVITKVWPNEFGDGVPGVSGQAILDGSDTLWVTSVGPNLAGSPGTWER